MQSARVKVIVGNTKETFKVPSSLLAQYSTAFKKLLNPLNDSGDEITLTDVTESTFKDFFIWLHAFEPTVLHTGSHGLAQIDGALNLAVFAERYKIYHLRNQASDVVRTALQDKRWSITPDLVSAVYKVAPAGSALRHLSFQGFVASKDRNDSTIWESAFKESDLGWDFFRYNSGSELYTQGIELGGACRFHDHSDIIRGWQLEDIPDCPYPHGAPRSIPKVVVSASVSVPAASGVVVEDIVSESEAKPVNKPLPSVEEVAEPEPVEIQPPEPSIFESSMENWAASEATETDGVELENGKFHPQEGPLAEENTVAWVSKTDEAEPVEVASSVAEEEFSYTPVRNARMVVVEDKPTESKVTLRRVSVVEDKPVEEKEPAVEEAPAAETALASEEIDQAAVSPSLESASMQRLDSVMSTVEPQSPSSKKKGRKNKNKKT